MSFPAPPLIAGGNILPKRFVYISAESTGAQCTTALQNVVGVTQDTTRRYDSTYCAIAGDTIPFQNPPNGILIGVAGSGGVTAGAHVESDANGAGITALFTADTNRCHRYVSLDTVASGENFRMIESTGNIYIPTTNTGITGGG